MRNMKEGKIYFIGKHNLYGYKVEVSVLSNGLAVNCAKHYPGSVSDLEILQRGVGFHCAALKKTSADGDI